MVLTASLDIKRVLFWVSLPCYEVFYYYCWLANLVRGSCLPTHSLPPICHKPDYNQTRSSSLHLAYHTLLKAVIMAKLYNHWDRNSSLHLAYHTLLKAVIMAKLYNHWDRNHP